MVRVEGFALSRADGEKAASEVAAVPLVCFINNGHVS